MDLKKRKRENDGEASGRKRAAPPLPGDEEVEEFFAILKRIQVATRYFQRRGNVGGDLTAKSPWNPSFQREDFDGVKTESKGFDLNSDPVCDVSDSG